VPSCDQKYVQSDEKKNENLEDNQLTDSCRSEINLTDKKNDLIKEKSPLTPKHTTSSQHTNAPYYYADLLSEEKQLELNKSNEDRPQLSSRCQNSDGSTSLAKLSINKKTIDNQQETVTDQQNEKKEVSQNVLQIEKISNSILSIDQINVQNHQRTSFNEDLSGSMNQICETEMYRTDENDPVYENVNRLSSSTRSQSSINLTNDQASSCPIETVDQEEEYSSDADMMRRVSQNYINQNAKFKPLPSNEKLNNQEKGLNNQQTPTKLNNTIENCFKTTSSSHLRSPTIPGYSTIDNEQILLVNEDYKARQSADFALNTDNQTNVNKLSWKPNLISHSSSDLNKFKPNNLSNHHLAENNNSQSSSAQSLNQLPRSEMLSESNPFSSNYYRQQSAPNLLNNFNYHGNNLNNNAEKCLANKQLNLNKNINKINNLLNGQDYVVYENANAERAHLLALQKQLQQQQELLYKQQQQLEQLEMIKRHQIMKQQQQSYIRNEFSSFDNQQPTHSSSSSLMNYNSSSSVLNETTIPYDHHLKNLQNVPILHKESTSNSKNYHNYQNVFQDEQS